MTPKPKPPNFIHMSNTSTNFRTCPLCEAMCGLEIKTEDNKVLSIKGDKKDPFSRGHICPKAVALQDIYEDPDRLKKPVKRTENGWQEITWKEAFDEVAENLKAIQSKYGNDAVGVYQGNPSVHNLGTMLFSPGFVRSLKTKNRFSATSVDQLPHHLAGLMMFGHGLLMPIPDIDRTDFWMIMGANPLVSNGSIMTAPDIAKRMKAIQERGGKVVVIDPRKTETAEKADQHIFVKPGTDVWLLLAMINEIFEQNQVQLGHLESCIEPEQVQLLKELTKDFTVALASQKTGVDTSLIKDLIHSFIEAKSAVCYGRMGLSTVEYGGISQWLINCINLLTGNLDSVGGAMFTSPAFNTIRKKEKGKIRFNRWQSRVRGLPEFGGELPSATLAEEILTEGNGQIKAMVTSCGNPVLSTPNGTQVDAAFEQLEFMVSIDIYINETTRHANIILPPATGLEVAHYDVSFHHLAIRNTVKYSSPVFEKDKDAKYDWEIFMELQRRMQSDKQPLLKSLKNKILMNYFLNPEVVLEAGFKKGNSGLTLKDLKNAPHGIDLGALKSIFPERLMTENGNINLVPEIFSKDLERLRNNMNIESSHLLLIGRRQLRSNNSWMHNSKRLVKGKERCTLLIHPNDAQKRNLKNGEPAKIKSRVGEIEVPVEISDEIMEGVVSIPHGWGHNRKNIKMKTAQAHAGVSVNDLTDEKMIDALTGNAAVNGVPVEVST